MASDTASTPALPATVAATWEPRSAQWATRSPSEFAGVADRPLFIGACPRSGTTLLRSLLDNHPDLAIPAETDFVIPLWKMRARFGDLGERPNRRAVGRWIFRQQGHGGARLRAGKFTRKQAVKRVAQSEPTLGSIIATCFGMYAEAHGKQRWGDKRPAYAGRLPMLFELFPDAQFINLVRDPRAAVASQIPLGWGHEEEALASAAVRWEFSVRRVDEFARGLRPDQLLDLRYEDMVRAPEATLEQVCAFAGLRAGDAIATMLDGERVGKFRPGWHDKLSEPISTDSVERWREKLDPHEIALVEHVAEPFMERLGYRTAADGATPTDADLRELRRQRKARARKWRREARDELKRRHVLYRRPVAAIKNSG
ncbi:MAG: sulfotransferase family protein [Solirubrobacteraceae bacterium]